MRAKEMTVVELHKYLNTTDDRNNIYFDLLTKDKQNGCIGLESDLTIQDLKDIIKESEAYFIQIEAYLNKDLNVMEKNLIGTYKIKGE